MEDQALRDAQYRKAISIAYFNSVNSAIELAKVMWPEMEGVDAKAFITEWRDWFIEEHKQHYIKSVAGIGLSYNKEETIKLIQSAKDFEDLKLKWRSISQDERNDEDIKKEALNQRKKYEKVG